MMMMMMNNYDDERRTTMGNDFSFSCYSLWNDKGWMALVGILFFFSEMASFFDPGYEEIALASHRSTMESPTSSLLVMYSTPLCCGWKGATNFCYSKDYKERLLPFRWQMKFLISQ
jgi:hypothetical protein